MHARRLIVGAAVMAMTLVGGTVPLAAVTATAAQADPVVVAAGMVRPAVATPAQAAAAIDARYRQLGGANSKLGTPTTAVKRIRAGYFRGYQHGRIYFGDQTGRALELIDGPIATRFYHLHGAQGPAGYPLTGPHLVGVSGGVEQVFEHGRIYYSPATHARFVRAGHTLTRYLAVGGPAGKLGLPRGEVTPLPHTHGHVTRFEHGRVFDAGRTGAAYEVMAGPIGVRFNHLGGAAGAPGFPLAGPDDAGVDGGSMQVFAHGRIYYSADTHARYLRNGPILRRYLYLGGTTSSLGMPDGEVRSAGAHNALTANFAHGRIYHSSHGTWEVTGPIFTRYRRMGTVRSWLGVPIGPPRAKAYGSQQGFQKARLQYHQADKRTYVRAAFRVSMRTPTAADVPYTYRSGCPVKPAQLRMLTVVFRDFHNDDHLGTIVVAASVVPQIESVFKRAHAAGWQFHKIFPVDHYSGSDVRSMAADNTSAFNCRKVTGNPYRVSQHSYGNAIDINTFENPYVVGSRVYPSDARTYLNRANHRRGMIWRGDVIESRFRAMGWPWGARWSDPDYQHFSQTGG